MLKLPCTLTSISSLLLQHARCALAGLLACAPLVCQANTAVPQSIEPADFGRGLRARSIGPAGMSGRVAAVVADERNRDTIYVGAASGGLWRTTNAGMTWTPLFDKEARASIGAIALDPRHPGRIWVGTGEGNPRNSAASGNGVYRSDDAGKTWRHMGLTESERIHRIVVDPHDSDTVHFAVLGKTWGPSSERGVYKTSDGGRSFRRVLYVDDTSGCADLVQDPRNSKTLLAALWSHRRRPYDFTSGGPGSGLWRSHDGGETWTRVEKKDGLPDGELGRIGLAIAASDPRRVYALVEAKKNVLLRSDDGGHSFREVNKEDDVSPRPFYYSDIRVDPKNAERLYRLASIVSVSNDGGQHFETLVPWNLIHPDHHALWIDPADPTYLIDGNDGGIAISRDHGRTWRFVRNLPLAQYYHIAVDDERPYHIYGGMQDNGSWRGPAFVLENGGIRNHHWQELFFGDGFATVPDPDDSNRGYAMSQGGWLGRWNRLTGERKTIRPFPPRETIAGEDGSGTTEREVKLRFNWNAAIALDPFDAAGVYYGSQFVHYSADRGATWKLLSPDLTSNTRAWQQQDESGGLTLDVTAAENHCSLITIAPSAVQRGVVWSGSDDGRVHVTTDGGSTWTRVDEAMPGLPPFAWCAHVEASKFDAAAAWAVFDDHRRSDSKAYLFATRDFGKTWQRLLDDGADVAKDKVEGPCLTIEQDPVDAAVLYLGTEHGLWISRDSGASWQRFTNGLPTVAVRSLVVQRQMHDLVIGTHGRAAYVIDDIRCLRGTAALSEVPLALQEPLPATLDRIAQTGESRFPGSEEFRGENRPFGALLDLWVAPLVHAQLEEGAKVEKAKADKKDGAATKPPFALAADEVELEITRATLPEEGRLVRRLRHKLSRGHNRIVWDLREDAPRPSAATPVGSGGGGEVLPGRYRLRVRLLDHEASTMLEVLPDPRIEVAAVDRETKHMALRRGEALVAATSAVLERLEAAREDSKSVATRLEELRKRRAHEARLANNEAVVATYPSDEDIVAGLQRCKDFDKKLDEVEARFRTPAGGKQGIADRDTLMSRVFSLISRLRSSWEAPSTQEVEALERLRTAVEPAIDAWNRFEAEDLARLREDVTALTQWLVPRPPIRLR